MASRIVLLVPDGVGVRNFVLGPFLRTALAAAGEEDEIHVLHAIPASMLETYRKHLGDPRIQWHRLEAFQDSPLAVIQRNSLAFAQTYWVDTHAMRVTRNRPLSGSLRSQAAMRLAKLLGRMASSPRGIRLLDGWHCRSARRSRSVEHYRRLFRDIKPTVLLCSHQRPPIVLAPVLAAREAGIPTASFIFSWDNLTSKGRIAAPFDHYLVWSELMRKELLQYYPDVPPERVHMVGTPQFDPYADNSILWTRQEFFRRIGADPLRPLICYSGGDSGNAPQDPGHVAALLDAIREGKIKGQPQVLLRPMPSDDGTRYKELRRGYPELMYAPAQWVHADPGDHASVMPLAEDVQYLANLTQHADLNINFGSTMTLDFALHDRPVINVAFDLDHHWYGMPLFEYQRQFEHYHCVYDFEAARFARSREELVQHVNAYLNDPSLDREGRRKLVNLQVGIPLGKSTPHILDVLHTLDSVTAKEVSQIA